MAELKSDFNLEKVPIDIARETKSLHTILSADLISPVNQDSNLFCVLCVIPLRPLRFNSEEKLNRKGRKGRKKNC
jgi:hypothetical protein